MSKGPAFSMGHLPVFTACNVHADSCGTPPDVRKTRGKYYGYFENQHGEQWVLHFDAEADFHPSRFFFGAASNSSIRLAIVVSRAVANFLTTWRDGILFPRSRRLTCVRWRPALSARASWPKPAASRRRRMRVPNCC